MLHFLFSRSVNLIDTFNLKVFVSLFAQTNWVHFLEIVSRQIKPLLLWIFSCINDDGLDDGDNFEMGTELSFVHMDLIKLMTTVQSKTLTILSFHWNLIIKSNSVKRNERKRKYAFSSPNLIWRSMTKRSKVNNIHPLSSMCSTLALACFAGTSYNVQCTCTCLSNSECALCTDQRLYINIFITIDCFIANYAPIQLPKSKYRIQWGWFFLSHDFSQIEFIASELFTAHFLKVNFPQRIFPDECFATHFLKRIFLNEFF